MSLGLLLAIAAIILGVLGLFHVVGVLVLAIALLVIGVLWLVVDRPWIR